MNQNTDFKKDFTARQKKLIECISLNPGKTLKEIAEISGYNYPYLVTLLNDPEIKAAISEIDVNIRERIVAIQTEALETVIETMRSGKSETVRLRAAAFLLQPVMDSFIFEESVKQTVKIEFVDEKPESIPEYEKNDFEQSPE